MDSLLLFSAISLGLTNHVAFHQYEPQSANIPAIVLVVEPMALLFFLGGPLSPARLLWTYAVFWGSLCISIVVYRLSPFHPLAKFPGPTMGKITKLWGFWVASRGHQYRYHKKLHDSYGPYVRTGPNELSVIDAPAVNEILNFGGLPKGRWYETGRHGSTPPTIVSLTGDAHTTKRRVWNRALASSSLRDYEPLIVKRASQLVSRLENQNGMSVDIVHWFDLFTSELFLVLAIWHLPLLVRLDLTGDLAFGGGFEGLREGKDVGSVGEMIRGFMAASSLSAQIPWIISTLHLFPQVGRTIQDFNDFGQHLAIQRIQKGAVHRKDLWYHLADEPGPEKEKPTLESSAADGIVAIVAASDTTAHTLSSLIWFLLSNPEYYQRVQLELDDVCVDGDDPLDVSKHQHLVLLSACINETLRLHPPLPSIGTRQVHLNSGGGRTIAGRFIPEGTSIYTPPYSLHRNPDYFFPFPDQFVPDRWLPGANFERHDTSAFIPFSSGPANCIGQNLAKRELLMVMSLLLKSFHLRFADGFDSEAWPTHIHDFFVATRSPLRVNLTRR
ncbi:high nitrogen upregulated cytochrome P450 monooxygenase 2 [Mycena galericulata]|nr:high nitrogen upregulated cytochrome P450 monooxygenase 2 [Mycena galericulata]